MFELRCRRSLASAAGALRFSRRSFDRAASVDYSPQRQIRDENGAAPRAASGRSTPGQGAFRHGRPGGTSPRPAAQAAGGGVIAGIHTFRRGLAGPAAGKARLHGTATVLLGLAILVLALPVRSVLQPPEQRGRSAAGSRGFRRARGVRRRHSCRACRRVRRREPIGAAGPGRLSCTISELAAQ